MDQTSLALLVFDPQDEHLYDTISYWQQALSKVGHAERLPNILVAARCDRPGLRITLDEIREWAAERQLHGPILTAAKLQDHPGVAELRALTEKAMRRAEEGITTASMEGIMVGDVKTIVFSADQIYRTLAQPDEGIDGEIEFRDDDQRATNLKYYVQLKSGDAHLRTLKDGTEKFDMKKPHYEKLWGPKPDTPPVLLIIRTSDKRLRYINATDAIRQARQENPGNPVTNLSFKDANDFTQEAVLHLRNERLGK